MDLNDLYADCTDEEIGSLFSSAAMRAKIAAAVKKSAAKKGASKPKPAATTAPLKLGISVKLPTVVKKPSSAVASKVSAIKAAVSKAQSKSAATTKSSPVIKAATSYVADAAKKAQQAVAAKQLATMLAKAKAANPTSTVLKRIAAAAPQIKQNAALMAAGKPTLGQQAEALRAVQSAISAKPHSAILTAIAKAAPQIKQNAALMAAGKPTLSQQALARAKAAGLPAVAHTIAKTSAKPVSQVSSAATRTLAVNAGVGGANGAKVLQSVGTAIQHAQAQALGLVSDRVLSDDQAFRLSVLRGLRRIMRLYSPQV